MFLLKLLLMPGAIVYFVLDFFPSIIQWIAMLYITYKVIDFVFFENIKGTDVISLLLRFIFQILPLAFLFSIYLIYYKKEIYIKGEDNWTILIEWFINIPFSLYQYFSSFNVGDFKAVFLLIITLIVAGGLSLLGDEKNISGNDDNDKDDYYSNGFSPSEEKEYHRNEKIRSITKNLKRGYVKNICLLNNIKSPCLRAFYL